MNPVKTSSRLMVIFILTVVLFSFMGTGSLPAGTAINDSHEFALFTAIGPPAGSSEKIISPSAISPRQSRTVEFNRMLFVSGAVKAGDRLILNLPAGSSDIFTVDRVHTDVNGTLTLRGRPEDDDFGYLLLTYDDGRVLASIINFVEQKKYIINYDPRRGGHLIHEAAADEADILEGGPPLIPPGEISLQIVTPTLPETQEEVTIDVMIVYTPAARDFAAETTGINTFIAQAMELGQLALDNSDVGVRLRLVHSAEVNYTEYNGGKGTDKDLERLRTKGDGFMDSVHTWRTQYGADLVNLFTFCHDYGGLGYMLATEKGNEALGFSISRVQQAWFTCTTLHEFGHNWGLHHSKSQKTAPGPGIYSYAAGWRWIGEDNEPYGSVMAYSEGLYTIVPYISNPGISYQGVATGHPASGDNAKTTRQTKSVIAGYRLPKLSDPPRLKAAPTYTAENDLKIIFDDDPLWRGKVTKVYVNEVDVDESDYLLEEGTLTIAMNYCPSSDICCIRVTAAGYIPATVLQPIEKLYFKSFSFARQTGPGMIDLENRTVEIEVDTGTDLTGLVADFTLSDGATAKVDNVDQVSGVTENDFSDPVTYTLAAADGSTADWKVTVTEAPYVPVQSVQLNKDELIIRKGKTKTLAATVKPENANNREVNWFSDEETIATVNDDGTVTAAGEGAATVSVHTVDGHFSAACTILVTGEDWIMEETTEIQRVIPDDGVATVDFPALQTTLRIRTMDNAGIAALTSLDSGNLELPPGLLPTGAYLVPEISENVNYSGITLETSFHPENLPETVVENGLCLYAYNDHAGRWEEVPNQQIDAKNGKISADLGELSLLAIFDKVLFGDVNLDQQVNVADAILILKELVGLADLSPARLIRAKVSAEAGPLSIRDAILVLQKTVGLITAFPVEADG